MEWVLPSQTKKKQKKKKTSPKLFILPPILDRSSHQDRVKRAHPKICSFYDHFSLGLLLAKGFYFDYAKVLFDDWFPVFSLGGQGRAEGPAHCPLQGCWNWGTGGQLSPSPYRSKTFSLKRPWNTTPPPDFETFLLPSLPIAAPGPPELIDDVGTSPIFCT